MECTTDDHSKNYLIDDNIATVSAEDHWHPSDESDESNTSAICVVIDEEHVNSAKKSHTSP